MQNEIHAKPVGRILRFITGAALTAEALRHLPEVATPVQLGTGGAFLGLLLFYGLVHVVVSRYLKRLNPWFGAALAVGPLVPIFLLGGPAGQLGVLAYVGVSLIATALRADGGCEVMTLPAIVLGPRTHLVCLVFLPLDWIEAKLSRKDSSASEGTS